MTRPTIRILLPPRPSSESYSGDSPVPQSPQPSSKRPYTSGASSVRSSTRSPAMTIRTRPSHKEDRHWHDTPPSSPRTAAVYPDRAILPSIYSYQPSRNSRQHSYTRPSSALAALPPSSPTDYDYYANHSSPPSTPPNAPRAPGSAISSAHSRRSSNGSTASSNSDYLYGEDFAYGTGPLYSSSYEKTEAALAAAKAEIARQKKQGRGRRRVRFV